MSISRLREIAPKELPGVHIGYLGTEPNQEVALVTVEPNGTIPLHSHGVDAQMTIISGSARVCSDNEDNDHEVMPGDCVFFQKNRMHGFVAGPHGLTFLSQNGGIRQSDGKLDLVFA